MEMEMEINIKIVVCYNEVRQESSKLIFNSLEVFLSLLSKTYFLFTNVEN